MHLELRGISKYFGPVKANQDISLAIEPGRIYGLLGENGAGKSTLMKILSGYQAADAGEIRLDGRRLRFSSPQKALAAGIGMLYQEPLDIPRLSVAENFLLGQPGLSLDLKAAARELRRLASAYGFDIDPSAHIHELSLGERQQFELVRLLAGGAEIIILDEPTTGISAEQKDLLFTSMRRLAREGDKTLILVSHKLSEVQELCDHAIVLRQGELAGQTPLPCPNQNLVRLMFQELPAPPARTSQPAGERVLRLRNVNVHSPRVQVAELSLDIRAGEIFGLAGLEGSGQDLLLRALAGFAYPQTGEIDYAGQPLGGQGLHARQARGIHFISAGRLEEGLVAGLTLREHVALSSRPAGFFVDWNAAQAGAQSAIRDYRVVGQPATKVEELSGGNQQRLLFGLLALQARLILIEHPTRGLDVNSANWIWSQLAERCAKGTAILFYSADLDELIERSDRIAAFSGGRMSRIVEARQTSAEELGHLIGGEA
jgi:simple sugar transport system ATP-binding protein